MNILFSFLWLFFAFLWLGISFVFREFPLGLFLMLATTPFLIPAITLSTLYVIPLQTPHNQVLLKLGKFTSLYPLVVSGIFLLGTLFMWKKPVTSSILWESVLYTIFISNVLSFFLLLIRFFYRQQLEIILLIITQLILWMDFYLVRGYFLELMDAI